MSELEGLRALVVGGGSGMGAAFARLARDRGARVFVVDVNGAFDVDHVADIADDAQCARAVEEATTALGGLDILACTAGIAAFGPVADLEPETYARLFAVNVIGAASLVRHARPALEASEHASVITLASAVAGQPYRGSAAYGSSKAALIQWTKVTAHEFGSARIRVNCVCPGPIDTPMLRRGAPEGMSVDDWLSTTGAMTALGRTGGVDEVAEVIAFLASPRASYITGAVLHVDGGESVNVGR